MSINLRNLIQHFSESDYSKFEVSSGNQSISLKRRQTISAIDELEPDSHLDENINKTTETAEGSPEVIQIRANRVGQFFPKVSIGEKVSRGQVLGYIKAMNIMNELRSAHVGIVHRLIAQHQEGVAYDELLLELSEENNEIS